MKKAAVCTIGDEILIGQIVDTNSSHIARALNETGVKVEQMISIQDDDTDIKQCFKSLLKSFDIIIVTGGLGPTKDDITKKALKEISGSGSYKMHEGQFDIIKRLLQARGVELSDINCDQAMVPSRAEVIVNRMGTAPCMVFRFSPSEYAASPTLYALPGVPSEAIGLLPDIMEDIKRHCKLENISHRTLDTFGIPESTLAKKIERWEDALPQDMKLAYLPDILNGVKLRLSVYGGQPKENERRIDEAFNKIRPLLGSALYGEGEDSLCTAIAALLLRNKKTLSVAESCTGGKIASLITSLPGASNYFLGSVTSYDNSVKQNILHVSNEILTSYGAVSKECAEAMASGVKESLKSDFALSTTGIAGPDGGSAEKPVGTVWTGIAYTDPETGGTVTASRVFHFSGERATNISRFSSHALNFLRETLLAVLPA